MNPIIRSVARGALLFCLGAALGTSSHATDITSNLIVRMKLDEGSGSTTADATGNTNNAGTLVGSPTWDATKIGPHFLTFNGTNYVSLPSSSIAVPTGGDLTVSAWVKTTAARGMIVSLRGATDDPVFDLAVGYNGDQDTANDGHLIPLVRFDGGGTTINEITGCPGIADGNWHFVALVLKQSSGLTLTAYVDGSPFPITLSAGGALTLGTNVSIGSELRWINTGFFDVDKGFLAGSVDDVRVYSRALSGADITALIAFRESPTISTIADQVATVSLPFTTSFTVDDPDTAATSLTLTGTSSNQAVVSDGGISFGGSGTSRTVTFTPATTGTATLTITVNDGTSTTSTTFVVTASPISAPVFTTQPSGQTAAVGASAAFVAAASGSPTPTYQWQKNGSPISGATNATFTISSVGTGDAGSYTVVASNTAGTATSSAATLTVNAGAGGASGDDYFITIDPNNTSPTPPHRFEIDRGDSTHTPTTLLTVLGTGFVGIGNPVPLSKLAVAGDGNDLTSILRVERGNGSAARLSFTHDSVQRFNSDESLGNMSLNPNGGNVGVGVRTPGQKFEVNGTTRLRDTLSFGDSDEMGRVTWGMAGIAGGFGMQAGPGRPLSLGAGANWNQLVVVPSGNVGIGTSSPTTKLEVNGGSFSVKPINSSHGFVGVNPGAASSAGYIDFFKGGPTRIAYLGYQDLAGNQSNLGLNLENSANFIIGGGSVGIGTASPRGSLDVEGGSVVFDGPKGGIYTTGTEAPFTITGVLLRGKASTPSVVAQIGTTGSSSAFAVYNSAVAELFHVSGDGTAYFNLGNVGIGTNAPSAKLDVAGGSHFGSGAVNISNTTNGLSVQDTTPGAVVAVGVGQSLTNSVGLSWEPGFGGHVSTFGNASTMLVSGSSVQLGIGGHDGAVVLDSAGNFGINALGGASERLDVGGNATIRGNAAINGSAVIAGNLKTHLNGDTSDPALTLGSLNSASSGSLRFVTNLGNWWGLSNVAGEFSVFSEPVGGGSPSWMMKFSGADGAQFRGDVSAGGVISTHGLDVLNNTVRNVLTPSSPTDAANKDYVDINSPFKWESGVVSLKNFANFVAIGTATNLHAPFTVGNSNADGEIARFQPWSENVSIHSTRSYISLYNSQNADCRWDLSVQDEWPGGGENGFSIRGKHQLDGDTQDRFYISPSAHSVDAVSIFRFYNQNPDNAWEMAIDPANGMSLYSAARGGAGTFDVKRSGLFVDVAGNVAIGTKNPNGYKLAVNGSIHAKELVIDSDSIYWPDYVFSDSHRLMPLAEVEQHIKEHKHLPGVPSAGEVAEKGIGVGQMQATLLAKVEELTLHLIEQEKRLKKLEDENAALRGR